MSFAQDFVMIESDPSKSAPVVEMKTVPIQPETIPETVAVPVEAATSDQTETQTSDKVSRVKCIKDLIS